MRWPGQALNIVTQREAFYDEKYAIDYNVIFLLFGMMVIVHILSKTGAFQFLAIKAAKLAKGRPLGSTGISVLKESG